MSENKSVLSATQKIPKPLKGLGIRNAGDVGRTNYARFNDKIHRCLMRNNGINTASYFTGRTVKSLVEIKSVFKSVFRLRLFQNPQEYTIDCLCRVFCITCQLVGVCSESIHISAVTHKAFYFSGRQRFNHRHKRVAQFVKAARRYVVCPAIGFPAVIIAFFFQYAKHAFLPACLLALVVKDLRRYI